MNPLTVSQTSLTEDSTQCSAGLMMNDDSYRQKTMSDLLKMHVKRYNTVKCVCARQSCLTSTHVSLSYAFSITNSSVMDVTCSVKTLKC